MLFFLFAKIWPCLVNVPSLISRGSTGSQWEAYIGKWVLADVQMCDWEWEIGWDQFVYRQISADSSVYLSGNLVPDIALVSSHCWQLLTICVKEIVLKRDQFLCCRNQLLHISGSVAQCVDRPHHWPLKLPLALHKLCASVRVQWGPGQFVLSAYLQISATHFLTAARSDHYWRQEHWLTKHCQTSETFWPNITKHLR